MAKSTKAVLVSKKQGFVTAKMLGVSRERYEEAIDESFAKLSLQEQLDRANGADVVVGGQTVHAELI